MWYFPPIPAVLNLWPMGHFWPMEACHLACGSLQESADLSLLSIKTEQEEEVSGQQGSIPTQTTSPLPFAFTSSLIDPFVIGLAHHPCSVWPFTFLIWLLAWAPRYLTQLCYWFHLLIYLPASWLRFWDKLLGSRPVLYLESFPYWWARSPDTLFPGWPMTWLDIWPEGLKGWAPICWTT